MTDQFVVGVIGLGYVGLPLIREFVARKISTLGFDIDKSKVEQLNQGFSYIKHIPSKIVAEWNHSELFNASTDFRRLKEADAVLICVPTPLDEHREPDLSYVVETTKEIARHLRLGQLVILESTTYPGTTNHVLLPILETSGLKVGEDFYLAYSPEREDPGNEKYTTAKIPKVVGGHTRKCLEKAVDLYKEIVEVVPVSSTQVAEASKILENTYRAVNIALVNELKMLFTRMNIDIWEVIEAAKTKPFGFQPFYPGPGLGGHCIPIDPFYLTWIAREYDFNTRFIELAGEINTYQPFYVVQKVAEALNTRSKAINGSKLLILGMAYKKNVDDMRESPALKIYELLVDRGAEVDYHDPFIPEVGPLRKYPDLKIKSIPYSSRQIAQYDLVLLLTDHDQFPYDEIVKCAKLIVDTRNGFAGNLKSVLKA